MRSFNKEKKKLFILFVKVTDTKKEPRDSIARQGGNMKFTATKKKGNSYHLSCSLLERDN